MKDRKILGAERGSLEVGNVPDDKANRASSQHSLSHNMSLYLLTEEKKSPEAEGQRGTNIKQ